jgi:hypothetical protein
MNIITEPMVSTTSTFRWSDVVELFYAGYDEIFNNMGRKAYFDFKKGTASNPNFVDVRIIIYCIEMSRLNLYLVLGW